MKTSALLDQPGSDVLFGIEPGERQRVHEQEVRDELVEFRRENYMAGYPAICAR